MPRRPKVPVPLQINGLTDVIQHPKEAWEEILFVRGKWHDAERLPPPTKLIVSGSRSITSYEIVKEVIETGLKKLRLPKPTLVIEGEALGPDTLARRWAEENKIKVDPNPADWERFGKAAGFKRNRIQAQKGEVLIAAWDGLSVGTANQIAWVAVYGLPIYVGLIERVREPTYEELAKVNNLCNQSAPSSRACALGRDCRCIQSEGHTTPHRAKCGAKWANRKRDK